eukprot:SAG11_NODE_1087_length_5925_cov_2.708376_1_plen_40_part_00
MCLLSMVLVNSIISFMGHATCILHNLDLHFKLLGVQVVV